MYPAFQLSQNVQEMRIHFWALKREDLIVPDNIKDYEGWSKIDQLTRLVLEHDLSCSGFEYTLDYDWDYSLYKIQLTGVAELVDQACTQKIEFPATYFPPPRKERPIIQLFLYDKGLWCLDQQVCELAQDLAIYQQLKQQLAEVETTENDDTLKQELTRNLQWIRQVNLSRTQIEAQRNCIQDLMTASMENQPEPEGPVRVEVTDGQTLSEAIFLALHNAS